MDFGTAASTTTTPTLGQGTVTAQCSALTPYTISLNAGANASTANDVTTRRMKNTNAAVTANNYVGYQLYQDAAHTLVWGATTGTNTQAGIGTGLAVPYIVYGQILNLSTNNPVPVATWIRLPPRSPIDGARPHGRIPPVARHRRGAARPVPARHRGTGATSLQVAPTSLQLEARQRAGELWLTNSGTSPVKLQVRVFRWVQQDGQEQLLPTEALMATPPMQELAAGQQQLVRVMRADKEPPAAQQHYRLIVDEVPDLATRAGGMQFVLRYSIPVFVQPSGTLAPQLQARLVKLADGRNGVEVANSGNSYAQIADLALGSATRPRIVHPGLLGYVLPGQVMRWPIERTAIDRDNDQITAKLNGESEQTPLSPRLAEALMGALLAALAPAATEAADVSGVATAADVSGVSADAILPAPPH